MRRVLAAFKLIRPLNGLVAALSLIPAGMIACGHFVMLWRESALVFFLVSFGYAVNDIYDVRADLINRPNRAIPSGGISVGGAWGVAIGCLLVAILIALSLPLNEFLYGIIVAGLVYLYAARISSWLIVGNVLVAALCASVFVLVAMVCELSGQALRVLVAGAILTFLYHLGREIVKDIEDIEGDRAISRNTVALKWGVGFARIWAAAIFLLVILAGYGVYFWLGLSAGFLAAISIGVNLPLVVIFAIYFNRDAVAGAKVVSLALKGIMLPALVALMFANVN